MNTIKINSTDQFIVERQYLIWLDKGFDLKKAYIRKKYIFFGQKKYYITMVQGEASYKQLIKEAIDESNFELAGKLTKEYEQAKLLHFE